MDRLNADCLLKIFTQLSITDRVLIETVCRRWYYVLQRYEAFNNIDCLDISKFLLYSKAEYYQQDNQMFEPMVVGLVSRVGPYLKDFNFGHSWELIGQPIIDALAEHCTQVKRINFSATIMNASLDKLLQKIGPQLEFFSLEDTGWIEATHRIEIGKHISRFKQVQELSLRNALIDCDDIEKLPEGLESLDISAIGSISIPALTRFFKCHQNLKKLRMSPLAQNLCDEYTYASAAHKTGSVDDDKSLQTAVDALGAYARELHTLKMGFIPHDISSLSLKPLSRLTNLRELTLETCQCLTPETIKQIAHDVPYLASLTIRDCPKLIDYSDVASMKALTQLHVEKTLQLSDEDLEGIAAQAKLAVLRTIGCINVTTKGISAIIQQCPLIELDVTRSINIGDSCLQTLAETPNQCHLRILKLNSCPYITGKGIARLAHSPKILAELRQLDVTRTKYVVNDTVLQLHKTLKHFWNGATPPDDPLICYCSHSSITPDIEKMVAKTIELVF